MGAGLNKIRNRISFINKKGYEEFIKENPSSTISNQTYIAILKESTIAIRDHILNNELGFKLPFNLGYIAVDKFKAKDTYYVVDWVNTKRLGHRVPLTNLHSFGNMFTVKLYANPHNRAIKNYKFKAHRILNRMLSSNIFKGKDNYISIDRSYFSKRFSIDNYLNK